ncbi:radical SAM protein [Dethiosulfatarculus sandiegensis]|uniref:Radical SAM core domain-containing protein n=1 Tax=Dethiosulfatarculus sandiegensis TaxID=1429043 RepID=A0A0D2GCK1_9BACT|nr:radical SAM protein [Dethiosulfatarculus sandiegensis]KIX12657.1 hypothetical protein X474_17900 [Dethiosulfatarculus sandiegensis]
MKFRKIAQMPWMHLFGSVYCNLSCPYCTQRTNRTDQIGDNLYQDKNLYSLLEQIPPTHFYLSGGEPLVHPGLEDVISYGGRYGHIFSLDTNICIPMAKLEKMLNTWNPDHLGFVNISHHFLTGIKLDYIMQRVALLKQKGIPNFVKYVGAPEEITTIKNNMQILRDAGIGTQVTLLQGNWNQRRLPQQYSMDELLEFLNMVTLNVHGLQFFNGIYSRNINCRAANDFVVFNMQGDRQAIPCCHTSAFPRDLNNTFFGNGIKKAEPCPSNQCLGDIMFVFGINGVTDEVDRFSAICNGESPRLGVNSVLNFLHDLKQKGYQVIDSNKIVQVERAVSQQARQNQAGTGNSFTQKTEPKTSRTEKPAPTGANVQTNRFTSEQINNFLTKFKSPDDIINHVPQLANYLKNIALRYLHDNNQIPLRQLAKKLVQVLINAPIKANIEVAAVCPYKCGFCTLHELHKYRRKSMMSFNDFVKLWRGIEPFTTEVEFTGGEPLMNKDLYQIIKETRKTNVHCTVTSNAFLLNKDRADKILEAQPNELLLAFDSFKPSKYKDIRINGNLDTLYENVRYLVEQKKKLGLSLPIVNVQMVVSKKNIDEAGDFWHEAKKLGADGARLKPILVWPGEGEEFENKMIQEYLIPDHHFSYHRLDNQGKLIKDRQPGLCPNTKTVHIGCGGEVIPCWYILKDTYIAGNAIDRPFLDIWFDPEYIEYRRRMKEETVSKACEGCIGRANPKLFLYSRITDETVSDPFREHLFGGSEPAIKPVENRPSTNHAKPQSINNRINIVSICAPPQTGSTWLQLILSNVLGITAAHPSQLSNGNSGKSAIVKFNEPLRDIVNKFKISHACFLVRDIRDAVSSFYHYQLSDYFKNQVDKNGGFNNIDDFYFEYYLKKRNFDELWYQHFEASKQLKLPFIRYENLYDNTAYELSRLLNEMGLPASRKAIFDAINDKFLEELKESGTEIQEFQTNTSSFFRRGGHGYYNETLSSEVLGDINKRFKPLLSEWGYLSDENFPG